MHLSPRDAEFASILVRRSPNLVSHEQLIAGVWGGITGGPEFSKESVGVYIYRLRRKIRALGFDIQNVPRCGWRLVKVQQ